MKISFLFRIFLFGIALITLYLAPWWITIPVAITGIVIFHLYELTFIGVLLDALYPQELFAFSSTGYLFTSILLLSVSASWVITKELRVLNN